MALIKCPECGKAVSDRAHACPQCGFPIVDSPEALASQAMVSVVFQGFLSPAEKIQYRTRVVGYLYDVLKDLKRAYSISDETNATIRSRISRTEAERIKADLSAYGCKIALEPPKTPESDEPKRLMCPRCNNDLVWLRDHTGLVDRIVGGMVREIWCECALCKYKWRK